MQIRPVHPFPARMAPELALGSLELLPKNSVVLDPMTGSGTVLRQAVALGHNAIGLDLDPLAVLMSRVWTTAIDPDVVMREMDQVLLEAQSIDLRMSTPDWHDEETTKFIQYWFAPLQRKELTRLAIVLDRYGNDRLGAKRKAAIDVLRVGLSRIIVTKEQCASLARDTSHSRPHRVTESSTYDVREGFKKSVAQIVQRLALADENNKASVRLGDARQMPLETESVDAILTSPPYLNAIDYMRGHRMSLVWLGHSISELRAIRSNAVGAERSSDQADLISKDISDAMCVASELEPRHRNMLGRYAVDLQQVLREAHRVLKTNGTATYVVGNSCLKGIFIRNSDGVVRAGERAGLTLLASRERELPAGSRYLPMTAVGSLSKRMRTETVLTFKK